MASDSSKSQPAAGGDHSFDHRLTDAYFRGNPEGTAGRAFVLVFGETSLQFTFPRGAPRSLIASRLRAFADRIEAGS